MTTEELAVIESALLLVEATLRDLGPSPIHEPGELTEELLSEAGAYHYEETLMKRVLPGASASGTCEYCEDNIEEGWIDSEDLYPTGDDGPPYHPNCCCEEFYRVGRVRVYESGVRVREGWTEVGESVALRGRRAQRRVEG